MWFYQTNGQWYKIVTKLSLHPHFTPYDAYVANGQGLIWMEI